MKNLVDIIKEELQQFDWGKDQVADQPVKPNQIVYHISEPRNRESIAQNGLQVRVGDSYSDWTGGQGAKNPIPAIFATDKDLESVKGVSNFSGDVWAIDTTKIPNKWFIDKHFEGWGFHNSNIVTFENIPRQALSLAYHPMSMAQQFR